MMSDMMRMYVKHAATMALLGLEIPDEDAARELLGLWRQVPELSDVECEEVVKAWLKGKGAGVVVFGAIPLDLVDTRLMDDPADTAD
jgi:hypothetical protein